MRTNQIERIRDAEPMPDTVLRRSQPVTVVGLLLLLQGIGMLAMPPILNALFGRPDVPVLELILIREDRSLNLAEGIGTSYLFMPLGLLALGGLALTRRRGRQTSA